MSAIKNRYDFVILFDVKDGNPNGDPDDVCKEGASNVGFVSRTLRPELSVHLGTQSLPARRAARASRQAL